jgi:hypothetical protein
MRPNPLLVSSLKEQSTGGQSFKKCSQCSRSSPLIKEYITMAKFYVQSGTLRAIVDSADAERAALWAVHTAMEQVIPLDSVEEVVLRGNGPTNMIALAETIQLSEIGFDRDDCLQIDTFEAFQHWNQLIQAVEKLQRIFPC